MNKFSLFVFCFLTITISCINKKNKISSYNADSVTNHLIGRKIAFIYFDSATISINFDEKTDSILQQIFITTFYKNERTISNDIIIKAFNYYKTIYSQLKIGWEMGTKDTALLQQYLPNPNSIKSIKHLITPISVYVKDTKDCQNGNFTIELDFQADINGMDVIVKNWEVVEVTSTSELY